MSSFLQNQLKNQLAAGFKNKLLKGTLIRKALNQLDEYGDPVFSVSVLHSDETPHSDESPFQQFNSVKTFFKVEGFPSKYSDYFRAKFGIPDTDLKIVLIAGNCETKPVKDDQVSFRGVTYQLRSVDIDPAEATYVCQAYEIQS